MSSLLILNETRALHHRLNYIQARLHCNRRPLPRFKKSIMETQLRDGNMFRAMLKADLKRRLIEEAEQHQKK